MKVGPRVCPGIELGLVIVGYSRVGDGEFLVAHHADVFFISMELRDLAQYK